MEVLITGASGFMGTHIVKELISMGITPVCHVIDEASKSHLSKIGVTRFCSSIADVTAVDSVIHLAARVHMPSERSLAEYRTVNVDFAVEVAKRFLALNGKQFVFMSTVNVYGDGPGRYIEDSPLIQRSPYGKSKIEAEIKLSALFKDSRSGLVILRPPMVFGPENKGNMLPLLKAAKKKMFLPLGASTRKRSMLYIGNLVSAVRCILSKGPRSGIGIYNIKDVDASSKELYSALTRVMYGIDRNIYVPYSVISAIAALSGKLREYRTKLFDEFIVDDSRFRADYAWEPSCLFQEAINRTVSWYMSL